MIMKLKFKKLLCILLTAAMVVPMAVTAFSETAEAENVKTVVTAGDSGGINYNSGAAYNTEITTLFGKTVRAIRRNTDVSASDAAGVRPEIYKNGTMLDENGEPIQAQHGRYLTVRYYYYSPDETPSLSGTKMRWRQYNFQNQNRVTQSATVTGPQTNVQSRDTVVANRWATVTFDFNTGSWNNWKKTNSENPTFIFAQYQFGPIEADMGENDILYIGDMEFTNYDPAAEIAAEKDLIFVSENGSDDSDGLTVDTPVKTLGKAYALTAGQKKATFAVNGTVEMGTISGSYSDTEVSIGSFNGGGAVNNFAAQGNTTLLDVALAGTAVTNGYTVTVDKTSKADGASLDVKGGTVVLRGGSFDSVSVSGNNAFANVMVDGAAVDSLSVSGSVGVLTLGVTAGSIGSVTSSASVSALQTVDAEDITFPDVSAISVSADKRISLTAPKMKASNGVTLPIYGTAEFGVFETYSGSYLNFGYGPTTYIALAKNEAGDKVYYSNSATSFKLTVPAGSYKMDVKGEKDYYYTGGTVIKGFSAVTDLTLPEGKTTWRDNGKGLMVAVDSDYTVVYVSNKYGSDSNDGLSEESPLKTLAAAVNRIGTSADGKVIILDSTCELYAFADASAQKAVMYDVPVHTGTITYEGKTKGAPICVGASGNFVLNGPSVFKNVALYGGYANASTPVFISNGYELTLDGEILLYSAEGSSYNAENVSTTANDGYKAKSTMELGPAGTAVTVQAETRITLKHTGVKIHTLRMASNTSGALNFGAKSFYFIIDGASVGSVRLKHGANSWANSTHSYGNVSYEVNSGSVTTFEAAFGAFSHGAGYYDNFQVVMNNNMGASIPVNAYCALGKFEAANMWIVMSADTAGNSLSVTEVPGTYKVNGGKIAIATNRTTNEVVYSEGGKLTLPGTYAKSTGNSGNDVYTTNGKGVWDVTYVSGSDAPYTFDGTVYTANTSLTVDLNNFAPTVPEGKIFIGWAKDAAGNQPYTSLSGTFEAGQKAYAIVIDLGLKVNGAQASITASGTPALRFVSSISKGLTEKMADAVYGTLVIPAEFCDGDLGIGDIPAMNVVGNGYDRVSEYEFTADLLMKAKAEYTRLYTARPYVTFTDLNGKKVTVYGDSWSVRLSKTASDELNSGTELDSAREKALKSIIDIASEALALPGEIIYGDITGISSYSSATEEDFRTGKVAYYTSAGRIFEWETMVSPIWDGDTVYDETYLFLEGQTEGKLLYNASEIISVRSYDLTVQYVKGVDYDIVDGKLVRLEGGSLPYAPDSYYYLDSCENDPNFDYGDQFDEEGNQIGGLGVSYHYQYDSEGQLRAVAYHGDAAYKDYQVCVTYKHDKSENIDVDAYFDESTTVDRMASFVEKLKNGEDVTVVVHGDSITRGRGSSMMRYEFPYRPNYAALFVQALAYHFGYTVEYAQLDLKDDNGRSNSIWASTADYPIESQVFGHNGTITYVNVAHSGWRIHSDRNGTSNACMSGNANCDCSQCGRLTKHLYNPISQYGCDLLILAFGMNNGWLVGDTYQNHVGYWVAEMARKVKANVAATDKFDPEDFSVLMVSPFLENYDNRTADGGQYAAGVEVFENAFISNANALTNTDGIPTAVARMSSVHLAVKATGMKYRHWTSNDLNHPNDFLHGLYAQVLLETVIGIDNLDLSPDGGYTDGGEGVNLREIHITGGSNINATDAVIGVVTDTHINVLNEEDLYDAETVFSTKTRSHIDTVDNLVKSLEFVSKYDAFAMTGDIIDYLTMGSLETLKKVAFDKNYNALYALGDHEIVKNMLTFLQEQESLEAKQALLQQYWPHNIYYTSKLVNNNVLMVQLDNSTDFYQECQVEQLKRDIELARENGYIIIIFQHQPVSTGNPDHTAVPSLSHATGSYATYDFYTGEVEIGGGASKKVYELMTKNADVVRAVVSGHAHSAYYAEINATLPDGTPATIPQYVNTSMWLNGGEGSAMKIVVKADPDTSKIGYIASVDAPVVAVQSGDRAEIRLSVSSVTESAFASGQFTLKYDPANMTFDGVEGAYMNDQITYDDDGNGTVTVGFCGETKDFGRVLSVFFKTKGASAGSKVTLEGAAFSTATDAELKDLQASNIADGSVSIVIAASGFAVTLPDIFVSDTNTVKIGESFTFSVSSPYYDYTNVTATVGGNQVTVTDNGDGTYTVPNVMGDVTVSGQRTPKSFSVSGTVQDGTFTGGTTATYGTDYTFTVPTGLEPSGGNNGYRYEATVTDKDGNTVPVVRNGLTYTVKGSDIVSDLTVTVVKVTVEAATYSVEWTGSVSAVNVGSSTATVVNGGNAVLVLNGRAGYTYTVTATVGGQNAVVSAEGSTYTVSNVSGNVVFNIVETVDRTSLTVTQQVQLNGSVAVMVKVDSEKLNGSVYTVNGNAMYWSEIHNAYVYVIITDGAVSAEAVVLDIIVGEAQTVTAEGDVNKSGTTDMNDAQLIWNVYNAQYSTFTASVTVEKFIKADVNGDCIIDMLDVAAAADKAVKK